MINWTRFKSSDIKERIKTVEVDGSKVLTFLNDEIYKNPEITVHDENNSVEVDLQDIVSPLGQVGRMLIRNNKVDTVRDIVRTYWAEQGNPNPKFVFDVASSDEGDVTLRNKIIFKEGSKKAMSLVEFFNRINPNDYRDSFDEVVIGGEGDLAEIQFLSTIKGRVEARPNDFLDAGVFVSLNGSVKVSAGVNRLICTNGLTKHFNLWNNTDFDFLQGESIFRQGMELATWFASKANEPVANIREISTAFGHVYPKSILMRNWKSWSEKIELKSLFWFDVINDLTSIGNKTLRGLRYRLLESGMLVQKMEETGCCPICSAKV
jgi:hypothetical protein